jgi:cbb3-type cytochrome oxidase maturation protein
MTGLVLLIPLALACGMAALAAFFWAMRTGQFEDLDGAAMRILIDDDEPKAKPGEEA